MMNGQDTRNRTLTIRIGKSTLSFTAADATNMAQPVVYEPYVVKSGISMAANLREAIKGRKAEEGGWKTQVMTDAKVLMVPVEQFQESQAEILYRHSYPKSEQDSVVYNVLPDLNAVAVFGINKDLRLVINDNFPGATIIHVMAPLWRYLHQRSFTGHRNKLYGYFHDKQLDIFSFQQNRFKFCNSFETSRAHDSLYFLLYVWKQLNLQPTYDEVHIAGEIPEREWVAEELKKYVQNAYVIPTPIPSRWEGRWITSMPFDLVTLLTNGR